MLCIPGLLLLVLVAPTSPQHHISVARKNVLKVQEDPLGEEDDTMSVKELCSVLGPHPGAPVLQEARRTGHAVFPEQEGEKCHVNEDLWDCIGNSQPWGLVFVDHSPMGRRIKDANRLMKNSQLVLIHDTENFWNENTLMNLPQDFIDSEGQSWQGRRCFTDMSDGTDVSLAGTGMGIKVTKQIFTSVIQGDMDTDGAVFDSVVRAFGTQFEAIDRAYRRYNPENRDYGTHLRLLLTATLLTKGNLLELGVGDFSTEVMHTVLEGEGRGRTMVSVESHPNWLNKYSHLASPLHQLLLVPTSHCYRHSLTCQDMRQQEKEQP